MKQYLLALFIIALFTGCSVKIDPSSINQNILLKKGDNVTEFLDSKTYSTYDEKEEKITRYYFKNKNGQLEVRNDILFLPRYPKADLYDVFSGITFTIKKLTNNQARTIEEALIMEVKRNDFKRLYTDKQEYIIGNDFANELIYAIDKFNEMMEYREERRN